MTTGEDWGVSVKLYVAKIGFYVEFHRKEGHNLGLRLLPFTDSRALPINNPIKNPFAKTARRLAIEKQLQGETILSPRFLFVSL